MIKKFLAKLVKLESPRKSNWTKAMEAQGLDDIERKKIMEEAKENLRQEQERLKQQINKSDKKSEDNHV